jgi:hypothetical protein
VGTKSNKKKKRRTWGYQLYLLRDLEQVRKIGAGRLGSLNSRSDGDTR